MAIQSNALSGLGLHMGVAAVAQAVAPVSEAHAWALAIIAAANAVAAIVVLVGRVLQAWPPKPSRKKRANINKKP